MESSSIKISIIKTAVLGIITYFFMYVFVSAVLLWFDWFSIGMAAEISLGFLLLGIIILIINHSKLDIKLIAPGVKETLFFVGTITVCVLLSGKNFGFYGMGQDQGVYQTKAIEMMYGNNNNELDFDYALKTIDNYDDYKYFRDSVKSLQGYYLIGQTDPFYADDSAGGESGIRGVYHGLPTWPAIMALFGKLFGMSHMQDCQTLFLICFLMVAFYILENFKIKTVCEIAVVAIMGTSPQIIWVSKSALTEMFLAVVFAMFIYLACNNNKNVRLFMWVPVAVFSVFHVSTYTMMPAFMIVSWINSLYDKRKRAVITPLFILVSYFAGFAFSIRLATLYTSYNYIVPIRDILRLPQDFVFTNKHLMILVTAAVLLCALITVLIPVLLRIKKIEHFVDNIALKQGIIIKAFSIIISAFVIILFIRKNGFSFNPNSNLVTISLASGILTVLLALVGICLVRKDNIIGIPYTTVTIVFLYILINAVLIRPYISYFYYYGRYNVPYLAVPLIFLCVIFRDFKKADWIPVICAASVFLYLDYDVILNKTPDDTKIEWNVVEEELTKERYPNSAVIIDNNHWTLLEWMLILKASGVDAYPRSKDMDDQIEKLSRDYNYIYYITEGEKTVSIEEYSSKPFERTFKTNYKYSEDLINGTDTWIGYPRSFYNEDRELVEYLLKVR